MTNNNFLLWLFAFVLIAFQAFCSQSQKRDRGETFYKILNSNTSGSMNWWLQLNAVGHIWDNAPISMESTSKSDGQWASNVRAFPEMETHIGLYDIAMISIGSRILGNFWSPGWFSGSCKLTWPNNKELRLNGYALNLKYFYQCIESNPSLGGYVGFMPEGFVTKGNNIETKFIYELDLLTKLSNFPLRLIANTGIRIPLRKDRKDFNQYLFDAAAIYSGYGFDFFVAYSLEAFNNFTSPALLKTSKDKRIAVFFSENPMYAIFGGTIRYDNGLSFSLSIPILLSKNKESKMTKEDLGALNKNESRKFPLEVKYGIKDPFDPWFVKWKISGSITFPIYFKLTGTEMMRNFLILKNRQNEKKIDIDKQLNQINTDQDKIDADSDRKRLEEIRKKKELIQK